MKHCSFSLPAALLALLPACFLEAQTIDLQVIGACGNTTETSAGSLQWTLGEMRTTESSNNGIRLADGFHQIISWNLVSAEEPTNGASFEVTVSAYPVPAIDYLRVESSQPVRVQLFDSNGKLVLTPVSINPSTDLDLSNLPAGNYYLQALDAKGFPLKTLKIQRIK